MRLPLLLVAIQLLALAPVSAAQEQEQPALDDLTLAWLAGLEQQGDLPVEMAAALDAAASGPSAPPALRYEDAHAVCDLDGDGYQDLIANELILSAPPGLGGAPSTVRAISGADGHELWKVSNLRYVEPRVVADTSFQRSGRATPTGADNVVPIADANDDGVCDVFAWGFRNARSVNLLITGISFFESTVKVLDGKTGQAFWTMTLPGQSEAVSDPFFGTVTESIVNGTPTGFVPILTPDGPKILLKTSDIEATVAASPIAIPRIPILQAQILAGAPQYRSARVDEHILLVDAKTGVTDWRRDILQAGDAKNTNITWIAAVGDVAGDDGLEIVLDQLVRTNPRANDIVNPIDGEPLSRSARGMRAIALSAETGETVWTSVVHDPLAVETRLPVEEEQETLLWTAASIGPDVDGDGKSDVLASYVTQQDGAGRGGMIRTHFAALHGANGTKMWDVRETGWGVVRGDGTTPQAERFLAFGTVDVPTQVRPNARFPPKFVRLGVLDGADGSTQWSYERSFAQNSYLSYNLALAQLKETLAPLDLDNDGRLDLLTPAQYAPATGNDQVLLSTSAHNYQLLSGADGATLQTYDVWGPQGRALACGAPEAITILSGHGRRVDLTRLDAATGARVWRHPLFNDGAPHAATSGVDVEAMGASCADVADGSTLAGVDLQLFSAQRRREVVPLLTSVDALGATRFLDPAVRGDPTTSEELLRASVSALRGDAPPPSPLAPILAGAALGITAGVGALWILRKGVGRGAKLLAVALGLMLLAGPVGALAPSLAITETAPAPAPPPPPLVPAIPTAPASASASASAPGEPRDPGSAEALFREADRYIRATSAAQLSEPWDANGSIFYTHPTDDLDGDAIPDLLVDDYCVDFDACSFLFRIPDDYVNIATDSRCGDSNAHHIFAMSARTKTILWDHDMMPKIPFTTCAASYLIGTPRLPDGTQGILVYEYVVYGSWLQSLDNTMESSIVMLDARTGNETWRFTERGVYSTDITANEVAQSVVVNPIIAQDTSGAAVILLQGVGYEVTAANTFFGLDPFGLLSITPPLDIVDSYQPLEWAASLDPATGAVLWRVDTFRDVETKNVLPRLFEGPDYGNFFNGQAATDARYWGAVPPTPSSLPRLAAHDVTGDGAPDLVYRVLEWSKTPWSKTQAPFFHDSRLVVVDGKTGARAIDTYVTKDITSPPGTTTHSNTIFGGSIVAPAYLHYYEPLGDVNGDGANDLLQHELIGGNDFRHVTSVVSGKDGKPIWNLTMPRDVRTLVLGDADGDAAPDVLFVDWFSHEAGQRKTDDYATPGELPLVLRSGATGKTLWRAVTYAAPADAVWQFIAMTQNGPLDVNGDGVMDVPLDAPEYLGDQSVIHTITIASGKDGSPLHALRTVGAFGVVASAGGDVTGDGRDDYGVLSGDANDLWLTLHDGATGSAVWSHRALQLPTGSYTEALPKLRLHALRQANGTQAALAVDLHVRVTQAGFFFSFVSIGGSTIVSSGPSTFTTTTPQLLVLDGARGDAHWGMPDPMNGAGVDGTTPGTKMYDMVIDKANHQARTAAVDAAPIVIPAAIAFGAAFPLTFAAGVGIVRFSRRFEGVPELE